MPRNKPGSGHLTFFSLILFSLETTHLLYDLNPSLPAATIPFALLFIKTTMLYAPVAVIVHLALRRTPRLLQFFPLACGVLVWIIFYGHQRLGGTFLEPTMSRIFLKQAYALLFLVLMLLPIMLYARAAPRRAIAAAWILLLLVNQYQYERRDAWHRVGIAPMEFRSAPARAVRSLVILLDHLPFEDLVRRVQDAGSTRLAALYERAARGRILPQNPRDAISTWHSLYTGSLPYRHRIFGEARHADPLFPELDLFPLHWPRFYGSTPAPDDTRSDAAEPVWIALSSYSISCALYRLPAVTFPPPDVSRAITPNGALPSSLPAEESATAFIQQTPSSVLLVHPEPEEIESVLSAWEAASTGPGHILLIDPIRGRWFLHAGPGVAPGRTTTQARVVDIVPTLLFVYRLPLSRNTDGRVLLENFTDVYRHERTIVVIPGAS